MDDGRPASRVRGDFHFIRSMIWVPTGNSGLNEENGSWGMKVMARPRTRSFTTAGSCFRRSVPRKRTSPPRIRAAPSGRTPRIARASVVLPQPLSPTSPTTSPAAISRLIPSSTWAGPRSVAKSTRSPRTASSSAIAGPRPPAQPRVEHVAQAVAEQVEAHHGEEDGQARRRRVPPCIRQEFAGFRDGPAPLRGGRRGSEPEEAERGRGQDGEAHADGGPHDDRRGDVGQHVQHGEPPGRGAEGGGALDEHLLLERPRLRVDHA